jgi:hypothetical protein
VVFDAYVPITELDSFNWLAQDICCRYNPEYPKAKIQRYLADHVRKLLIKAGTPKKRYRISRVGNYNIEGEHIFCYGKGVIRSSDVWDIWKDKVDIVLDPMPYNMDVDPNLSEAATAAGMLELVSLNQDAGRVLMSHTLTYLMRPAYVEAWKAPRCCVFVVGRNRKTENYVLSLYDSALQPYHRHQRPREVERKHPRSDNAPVRARRLYHRFG